MILALSCPLLQIVFGKSLTYYRSMPVILIVRPKNGPVTTLAISSKPVILGRSSSCTLKVPDDLISSKHLAIKLNATGEVLVKDLETTNGTYLNGMQVRQDKLFIGDELKIGDTVLTIDPSELTPKEKRALTREGGQAQALKFVDLKGTDPSITTEKPVPKPKPKLPEAPQTSQTEDTVHLQSPKEFKPKKSPADAFPKEMALDEEIDIDQLRNLQEKGELSEEEQTLLEEKIKRRVLEKSRKVDDISRSALGAKLGKDDEEYDLESSSGATQMIKIDRKLKKRSKTRKEIPETKIESLSSKLKSLFSKKKTRDEEEDED